MNQVIKVKMAHCQRCFLATPEANDRCVQCGKPRVKPVMPAKEQRLAALRKMLPKSVF